MPDLKRIECPRCEGSGVDPEWGMECCGNTTSSGECRGDCVVPKQEVCKMCGGDGEVEGFIDPQRLP